MKRMLIAVNGNIGVLHEGLRAAREKDCWVTVLKVLPRYEGEIDLTGIDDLGRVLTSGEALVLAALQESARPEGPWVRVRVENGPVHEKIMEVAREERSDVIVVGEPGKGLLRRLIGDATVRKLRRQAPCRVLAVGA